LITRLYFLQDTIYDFSGRTALVERAALLAPKIFADVVLLYYVA
jgi:hypothetical protein